MSTKQRMQAWWHGREPRERVMLAAMVLLLAAFSWWYGLLWPLRALRDAAQSHYHSAVAAMQVAQADAAALAAGGGASKSPVTGEPLQMRVLDSARDSGLAPSRQRTAADGAFVLEFDGVAPGALFGWLGRLATDERLAPSALRVERANGRLRAEVGFSGAAP